MNPFSLDLNKDTLFNIGSSKAATKEATSFHFMSLTLEVELVKNLLNNIKEPNNVWKNVKKQKKQIFAKEGANFKLTKKNKIMEVKMKRDLFGTILFLALQRKIYMAEMLSSFWQQFVPLCLEHIDGLIQNTPKSSLLKKLEAQVISEAFAILALL